jgi:hypothetical protein
VPLDPRRRAVAMLAAIIFIVCFTPVPIDLIDGEAAPTDGIQASAGR